MKCVLCKENNAVCLVRIVAPHDNSRGYWMPVCSYCGDLLKDTIAKKFGKHLVCEIGADL